MVEAAVIAENIKGLRVRDLEVNWPDLDPMPRFNGLWCRNVEDGVIDAPSLTGSLPDVDAIANVNSDLRIR